MNFIESFCNTVPTPYGGSHESSFKSALLKSIRNYSELCGFKKFNEIIFEDIYKNIGIILSIFLKPISNYSMNKVITENKIRKIIPMNHLILRISNLIGKPKKFKEVTLLFRVFWETRHAF